MSTKLEETEEKLKEQVEVAKENKKKDEEKETSVRKESLFYKICIFFWIFYLGSFLGNIVETLYCIFKVGIIESRTALIYENLIPIYGLGALVLILLLHKIKDKNVVYIFFVSGIAGGLFEALCSLMQEIIYGSTSWHYSADQFGILGGRTSLIYCIYWGVLGSLWIKSIYPFIANQLRKIKVSRMIPITIVFMVIFTVDVVMSSGAIMRQRERVEGIEAQSMMDNYFDENYSDERLKEIYPNMVFTK